MSTRFVVAAAAAVVVGVVTENPVFAAQTFAGVYGVTGFLDPNIQVRGPKLDDLKGPSGSYGAPRDYVEGHPRVAGKVLWCSEKYGVDTTTSTGKGSPGTDSTTTTYYIDMIVELAENPGFRPRRCWSTGGLVWSAGDDADAETLAASAETTSWLELVSYTGGPTQMPDPTYEAAVGAGNAPANRGSSTIKLRGVNLGSGGYLPVLTWEITQGEETVTVGEGLLCHFDELDGSEVLSALGPNLTGGTLSDTPVQQFGDNAGVGTFTPVGPVAGSNDSSFRAEGFFFLSDTGSGGSLIELGSGSYPRIRLRYSLGNFYADTATATGTVSQLLSIDPVPASTRFHAGVQYCTDPASADYHRLYWFVDGTRFEIPLAGAPDDFFEDSEFGTLTVSGNPDEFYYQPNLATADLYGPTYAVPTAPFTATAPAPTVAIFEPTLEDVVERQWERAGLDLAYLDATALADRNVRSMAVSQISSAGQVIENLMAANLFEPVETDAMLMVPRGGEPVGVIPYEDLGATNGTDIVQPLPMVRGNELELAAQVGIKFSNVDDDYQDGLEQSPRLATGSVITTIAEVPLGLTPTEAKRLAENTVTDALASLVRVGPFSLTRKWSHLIPTHVVIITGKDGSLWRVRILKLNNAAGLYTFEGVLDDAGAVNSDAVTSGGYTSSTQIRRVGSTELLLLDSPIFREADDDPGVYALMRPATGTAWRTGSGATLFESADGVTYSADASVSNPATFGVATTELADFSGWVFDETGTVTVSLGDGTAESYSRDTIIAGGARVWMIGSEALFAVNADLVSPGVYTLGGGLLRGMFGTEWATGTHEVGESVAFMSVAGTLRVARTTAELNAPISYKPVTSGKNVASVTAQTFTDTGVGLKPYAPVDLVYDASARVLSWHERSRYPSVLFGPFVQSETPESWDVELYDGINPLPVSTDTVSTASWTAGSGGSSALTAGAHLLTPSRDLMVIGGELVGLRDDNAGVYTSTYSITRHSTAGALLAESAALGTFVYQLAHDGDEVYAATADISGGISFVSGKVKRLTRTALGSVAATYTAANPGDVQGIVCDGTNVWFSEFYGGNIRKLHKTTLASVASYAFDIGCTRLYHNAGNLWLLSTYTAEVVKWNIGTTSETLRFSTIPYPAEALIVGSIIFVRGAGAVASYNMATGALIASVPAVAGGAGLFEFGAYVAAVSGNDLILIDSTTGLLVQTIDPGVTFLYDVAGADGSTIYLTTGEPGSSASTDGYELSTVDPSDLAGYHVTVYRNSPTVGRGYPATLEF